MTEFMPISALIGGALIGSAAVILMFATGRIAGVSGVLGRLLPPYSDKEWPGRLAFVIGLVLAPVLYSAITQQSVQQVVSGNIGLMIAAGVLVGFGATLGSGCTSGHGVCGLSRFSVRSLAAVVTFMAAGFITVFLTRHVIGGL
jgi:uncharacterized protein